MTYMDALNAATSLYRKKVGWEQEYDTGNDMAYDKMVDANANVVGACEVIANMFGMDKDTVADDLERVYTGC